MRRCLALAALAAGLLAPSGASAFPNGRASSSDLAPVYIPSNRASLAKDGAAAWNTMRLCSVTSGVDLYPGPSSATPARTAYRDYAGQLYVWHLYQTGRGALAAFPGTSNHGTGRAVDLALVRMRLYVTNHGAQFGWRKIEAPSEWWHVNYVGGFHRPDPGLSQRFPVLRKGSGGRCQGAAVQEAQRRLGVRQDGEYGNATRDAVVRFQRARHLHPVPAGAIGRGTWNALRSSSRGVKAPQVLRAVKATKPVAGIDVKAVQGLLNARMTEMGRTRYRVKIDGVLGPRFVQAVRRFQSLRRVPVTGKVDARTMAALRVSLAVPQTGRPFGPDVSEHNGNVDFTASRRAGANFVVVKTSEGQDFRDSAWTPARVRAVHAARFPLGFSTYHYLHPRGDRTGAVEASYALRVATGAGWRPRDGAIWADVETTQLGPAGTCRYVDQFESYLEHRHVATGVYTFPGFAHQYLGGCRAVVRRPSWRAHYGARRPDPYPWPGQLLWQFTEKGHLRGIASNTDLSVGANAGALYRLRSK